MRHSLLVLFFLVVGCSAPQKPIVRITPTPIHAPTPSSAIEAATRAGDGTTWTRVNITGDKPVAREGASFTPIDDGMVLFGGRQRGYPLEDLWLYDTAQTHWTPAPVSGPKPTGRAYHAVTFDTNRKQLIVIGGQAGQASLNDIWAYTPRLGQWRQLARASVGPSARYGSCAVYDSTTDQVYLFGGTNGTTRYDDIWRYDLINDAWEDISPPGQRPSKRSGSMCASVSGQGVVVAGGLADRPLTDFWTFQPQARRWTSGAGAVPPRTAMAWTIESKRFVTFGGRAESGPLNESWGIASDTGASILLQPGGTLPVSRVFASAAFDAAHNTVYLFGGLSANELDELWVLERK